MADSIDWTDETLRPLGDLARIAFPEAAGVTADTLRRRARQGKLIVYRPGKFYVASLAGIRAMMEATRVIPKPKPQTVRWSPEPRTPNPMGLSDEAWAKMRSDAVIAKLDWRKSPEHLAAKRLRDEERARNAPARRIKALERRRKRARERYREMKADRERADRDKGD